MASKIYPSVRPKAHRQDVNVAHGKFFDDDGRITNQDPSVGMNEAGKVIKMKVNKEQQKKNKKRHDELYHS